MGRADLSLVADPPGRARQADSAKEATLVVACSVAAGSRRWIPDLQDSFAICEVNERKALERVVANLKPDVLVIDLALPGLRRLRGLRDIRHASPDTRILVLTETPSDSDGILALKAGARGFCARSLSPEMLKKALVAIHEGEIWAPRKLVRVLIGELVDLLDDHAGEGSGTQADPRLKSLTDRQKVVARLISRGASNKEIGHRLNICERTVKAHVTEAFRNAGVSDRLHLALLLLGHPQASGSD